MPHRALLPSCLLAILLLTQSGCGQRGPLYLPDHPPPGQQSPVKDK